MGALFSYALQSSVLLCIGYLIYKWLMAGERQHSLNRAILYAIYACTLLLPTFTGRWDIIFSPASQQFPVIEPDLTDAETGLTGISQSSTSASSTPVYLRFIVAFYIAGMVFTLISAIAGAVKILSVIRNGEKIKKGDFTLVLTDRNDIAPFSCASFYVMSREDYISYGEIISIHECQHLRLRHWIDLIVVQAIDILQWFNPSAWLMGEEFKTVHEYQADEAVMHSDVNLKDYQTLLVRKAVGPRFPMPANSLNNSKLKKRVSMMYKAKSSKMRRIGAILLVPAMAIGCAFVEIPAVAAVLSSASEVAFATTSFNNASETQAAPEIAKSAVMATDVQAISNLVAEKSELKTDAASLASDEAEVPAVSSATVDSTLADAVSLPRENEQDDKTIVAEPAKQAMFPGGSQALLQYMIKNLKYPEEASKNEIQGRVMLKFVVNADGTVSDPTIMKGVDPLLDKEAIRIANEMPKWIPAEDKDGNPVATIFIIPVTFKLPKDKQDSETK